MGICGEKAYQRVIEQKAGNSSYRNYLIDEVFNITGELLVKRANYEVR
jgi:hydroxyethylthiazole kinase